MAVPRQSDVPTFQAPAQQRLEFIPKQVVVRVHEQALLEAADAAGEPLDLLAREAGMRSVEPLFAGMTLVELEEDPSHELLRRVESSPAVAFAEPVPARWPSAAQVVDPKRNRQWGLRSVCWFDTAAPSANDVTVAICDTGVDAEHPDLAR